MTTNLAARRRLLFLCQTLPYPADGGVHIRTYNIMRLLARDFDVTALCFYRKASRPSAAHVEASIRGLNRIAAVQAFPIPQDRSRVRLIWDHVRSVLSQRVYTRYVYDSSEFRGALSRELASTKYDVVHVDSLDLASYLPAVVDLPVICTHHNVESDLLRRRAAMEPFPLSAYLRFQSRLMETEERKGSAVVDLSVAVSRADSERLTQISGGAPVLVVPNGVDTEYFRSRGGTREGIVFVGGYTWYPNRDALGYFAESILPLIRGHLPDVPVTWVGDAPDSIRQMYESRHNIRLTGFVDDVRPYIDAAACYVVPLRVGGGTRLKILDAWAMSSPVVSTSLGCEGLDAIDGENILIRDTPEAFAEAVVTVLRDTQLRSHLAAAARHTAERTYDWDVIGRGMLDHYRSVAVRHGAADAVEAVT